MRNQSPWLFLLPFACLIQCGPFRISDGSGYVGFICEVDEELGQASDALVSIEQMAPTTPERMEIAARCAPGSRSSTAGLVHFRLRFALASGFHRIKIRADGPFAVLHAKMTYRGGETPSGCDVSGTCTVIDGPSECPAVSDSVGSLGGAAAEREAASSIPSWEGGAGGAQGSCEFTHELTVNLPIDPQSTGILIVTKYSPSLPSVEIDAADP